MPLKSEMGGHKVLAQTTITEVDGMHSNSSQMPIISWGRGKDQGSDKDLTYQGFVKCAANVQTETLKALAFPYQPKSLIVLFPQLHKSTCFLHSKRLTTTCSSSHDNYTAFELDL